MSILVKKGERAVIVGSTGSGKTQMLLAQIRHYPQAPIYILDTKGDSGIEQFLSLQDKDSVQIIKSPEQIAKFAKKKGGADFCWIQPSPEILSDEMLVDEFLWAIYEANKPCLVCIDEVYQVHKNGRAGKGLIALLTRGRSKGMALICCTQKPVWASRFVFSESNHFFIYRLTDDRDYKTIRDMGIPFPKDKKIDKFYFFYYKAGEDKGTDYLPIVLQYDPGYTVDDDIGIKKWV